MSQKASAITMAHTRNVRDGHVALPDVVEETHCTGDPRATVNLDLR